MRALSNADIKNQLAALDKMRAAWAEQTGQDVFDGVDCGPAARITEGLRRLRAYVDEALALRECPAIERRKGDA